MKRFVMAVMVLGLVAGFCSPSYAIEYREYNFNISTAESIPTGASGTSTFYLVLDNGLVSGTTVIKSPHAMGREWTLQVDSSSSGASAYEDDGTSSGVTYTVTLYMSDFESGGSPYAFLPVAMSGNSTYAIPFNVPTVKSMWATLTSGISGFWNFPLRLVAPGKTGQYTR